MNGQDGQQQMMLISFNWCGKHQMKEYRLLINNYDLPLGLGVGPGNQKVKFYSLFCAVCSNDMHFHSFGIYPTAKPEVHYHLTQLSRF